MISEFKRRFYFLVARYFRFWANFRLKRWKPTVIVVTGSSGKTTLLHLLESQLGKKARYSHHANSAIGIPFDILGMVRKTLTSDEWLKLCLSVFVRAFSPPPPERLYVVEADCDRPGEGRFLAKFLKPDITVWLNATRTHSMNFERLVKTGKFRTVEDAVAYEFGYFAEYTSSLTIVNADQQQVAAQIPRTKSEVVSLKRSTDLGGYRPGLSKTKFTVLGTTVSLPALVPEDTWYAVAASVKLVNHLGLPLDPTFSEFRMPPGRSSVLEGKKGVTIVDSSYNANLSSMMAVLSMFAKVEAREKWLVISDMLEQGSLEREEHERLAQVIADTPAERVILMGPRTIKYTYPALRPLLPRNIPILIFETPKEVLSYLSLNLVGRETVLFKGGRFLEGVIEHLLKNPDDARLLCRREKIWQIRRKKWGL